MLSRREYEEKKENSGIQQFEGREMRKSQQKKIEKELHQIKRGEKGKADR